MPEHGTLPDRMKYSMTSEQRDAETKQGETGDALPDLVVTDSALPHYGFSRPSSDYYNTKLMLHCFIRCDSASKKESNSSCRSRAEKPPVLRLSGCKR